MKKLLFALLYYGGATRLATFWNRRCMMSLCYHGVTKRAERRSQDKYGLHVRVGRFEKQLNYLKRHYRVVSLSDFLKARRDGQKLPANSVVLTSTTVTEIF